MSDWKLIDHNKDNTRTFESRKEAEDTKQDLRGLGAKEEDLEIVPPDSDASADGGTEVVEQTPEEHQEVKQPETTADVKQSAKEQLPDEGPSVDEDPLTWMPGEFTEKVDGTVTITRKGFEVLAHHYDVSGGTEMLVSPVDTDMEYTVHKATVTDSDGKEYTAFGEAHASDNGEENIVRMSDTRAYKRAVSRATGVGTIAIEELQEQI
jgi:hypothetical protein